jgi:hypothetical protein
MSLNISLGKPPKDMQFMQTMPYETCKETINLKLQYLHIEY